MRSKFTGARLGVCCNDCGSPDVAAYEAQTKIRLCADCADQAEADGWKIVRGWEIEPGDLVKDQDLPFHGYVVREGMLQLGRHPVAAWIVERQAQSGIWVEDVIFKEDAQLVHKGPF